MLLLALNILLKLLYLTTQDISHDEPFSIYHAQFDFWDMIAYLKHYNNPPLFEIILHFWIKAFGISEFSVRLLPMLVSSVSVVFIYLTGRDFFDRRIAIIASLLFSFSTMQLWYAHDCRVYSLFLLLTLISFYLFFSLLKAGFLSRLHIVLLIVSNTLLIYAHYFGLLVWMLQGLIIVLYYLRNRRVLLMFFGVMMFSSLLYIPHILTLYQRFSDSAAHGTWLKAPIGLESLYNMIWSFSNAPVVAVLCLTLFAAALLKFFVFSNRKIKNPFTRYVILWFVIPFFFMFFVSYKIPMFLDRYLIYITPAFYLLLALSVSFLFSKRIPLYVGAGILVLAFAGSVSLNRDKKREVRKVVNFVKSKKDSNTLVLVCAPEFMTTFAYYYKRPYFEQLAPDSEYALLTELLEKENVCFINRIDSALIAKAAHYNKLIYLDAAADFSLPGNGIKNYLLQNHTLKEEQFYEELFHIYVF